MRYFALTLILLVGTTVAEEQKLGPSFICIPDGATGFYFDDASKMWKQANFRVAGTRYLVRPIKAGDSDSFGDVDSKLVKSHKYAIWTIGEEDPQWMCEEGVSDHNWLKCETSFAGTFSLNSRTLRYSILSDGTYMTATLDFGRDEHGNMASVEVEDNGGDSPFVEIGKCSSL